MELHPETVHKKRCQISSDSVFILPSIHFKYIRYDGVLISAFSFSFAVLNIHFISRRKFGCVLCLYKKFTQAIKITDHQAFFKNLHNNSSKHVSHPFLNS